MAKTLVKCEYGERDGEAFEMCCLRRSGDLTVYYACDLVYGDPCPYGKRYKSCDTCAHKSADTVGDDGRMVDCDANDMQMYSPFAMECVHWEKCV